MSDVDQVIHRQSRQDRLLTVLVAAFLIMALVAASSLYAVTRLASVVDRNARQNDELRVLIEQQVKFQQDAKCALQVQARILVTAGEVLTVDHTQPGAIVATRDAVARATEDLRRFNAGEPPCDIVDNPS